MPSEDKESPDGLRERTPEQIRRDATWMATGFAIAVVFLVIAGLIIGAFTLCSSDTDRQTPRPCEDQAPIGCLQETIEQASSSQFVHYVYCGCVTDDGSAIGYLAATKRHISSQRPPEIVGRDKSY